MPQRVQLPYNPKPPRPAPHAVVALTTYEILEAILLRLDEQTLLVSAQRVSTLWHRVVTTSFPLQRRLFFLPSSPPPPPSPGTTTTIMRKFNPFLQRAFPCLLPARSPFPGAILPPFLGTAAGSHSLRPAGAPPLRPSGAPPSDIRPPILDARFGGGRRQAYARAGASWRRMLLADPPPRRVVRTSAVPGGGRAPEVIRVLDISPGGEELTMGEYYDAVCDVKFRRRDGSGEWGQVHGVHGAWAAWRWKVVIAGESGGTDAAEGAGSVAGADLVIGELGSEMWWDWGRFETSGCQHWDGPKGRFCLLRPERDMALYWSEDYCARDRLWLGPPIAERPKAESQVHGDRTEESWEDWEDEPGPE